MSGRAVLQRLIGPRWTGSVFATLLVLSPLPLRAIDLSATISGRVTVARGEQLPKSIRVTVSRPAPKPSMPAEIPETTLSDCAISDDGTWHCSAPATTIDVTISADGFGPRYLFDLQPDAERTIHAGDVALVRGASISGWLRFASTPNASLAGVPVQLETAVQKEAGAGTRKPTVKTNSRGFFQFSGVSPGTYAVMAQKLGWTSGRLSGITIARSNEQYVLQRQLVLMPLARLDVTYSPSVSANGKPWRLRVERLVPDSTTLNTVADETLPLSGSWSKEGLQRGTYRVSLLDDGGSVRGRSEVQLLDESALLSLNVSEVGVHGRVRSGGKPLAASLIFQERSGARTYMKSDDDGNFQGSLMRDGNWRVSVQPKREQSAVIPYGQIDIHPRSDGGSEPLEIELPDGRVHGFVVNEKDEPVAAAVAVHSKEALIGSCMTAADGMFDIGELAGGPALIEAQTATASSGSMPITIAKSSDDTQAIRVVVAPQLKVSGRILSPFGEPVAGAMVRYVSSTFIGRAENTISGPDGTFVFTVPPATRAFDAVVLARGFPVHVATIAVPSSPSAEPAPIRLAASGGTLKVRLTGVPPWPFVSVNGSGPIGLRFFQDAMAIGIQNREGDALRFEVDPGVYIICRSLETDAKCVTSNVRAAEQTVVDGRDFWNDEERRKAKGRM